MTTTLPNIFHKEIEKIKTRIGLKTCSNSSIFSKEKIAKISKYTTEIGMVKLKISIFLMLKYMSLHRLKENFKNFTYA